LEIPAAANATWSWSTVAVLALIVPLAGDVAGAVEPVAAGEEIAAADGVTVEVDPPPPPQATTVRTTRRERRRVRMVEGTRWVLRQ
jgi:hypothetical protein